MRPWSCNRGAINFVPMVVCPGHGPLAVSSACHHHAVPGTAAPGPAAGRPADGPPKFFGKQVRREGPVRRFVYIRIGKSAGQIFSEWTRRMKIDIHDIEPALLGRAISGGVLEGTIDGTAPDGSPACATIRPVRWRIV